MYQDVFKQCSKPFRFLVPNLKVLPANSLPRLPCPRTQTRHQGLSDTLCGNTLHLAVLTTLVFKEIQI